MLCRLAAAALLAAALPLTVQAALKSSHAQDQDHAPVAKRLPAAWYQAGNHPAHALFKRQSLSNSDGSTYPTVGSQEWYNAYPPGLLKAANGVGERSERCRHCGKDPEHSSVPQCPESGPNVSKRPRP